MSAPTILPAGTTTLQRLFAEMPRSFSRDPLGVGALKLYLSVVLPTDFISITIADAILSVNSSVSYIDSETLDLRNFTINNVIDYFNGKYGAYGITAARADGTSYADANYLATTLLEGIYDIGSEAVTLDRFTSNNYALLAAIAIGLLDNSNNMTAAITQTDLRQSSGKWTDYWGHVLGVERLGSEVTDDIGYRNRIQREVVDQKANNIAIEKLAETSVSRKVNIVDGGQPFILSGSYNFGSPLPTFGSSLAISSVTSVTFNGYISNTTLYVTSNPIYSGTSYNGIIAPGMVLSGSGISTGTVINAFGINGLGWQGDYIISATQNVSSTTITGTYPSTSADIAYRIGPTTGAGSFIVYVEKLSSELVLPQSLTASLTVLINRWKAAGILFVIKPM